MYLYVTRVKSRLLKPHFSTRCLGKTGGNGFSQEFVGPGRNIPTSSGFQAVLFPEAWETQLTVVKSKLLK